MTAFTQRMLACVALVGLVWTLYWPVHGYGFVNYDDPEYVAGNEHVLEGITLPALRWAFTSFYASNWHPLTWVSHMADCQMFGFRPGWHHAVNVLFHSANAVLLFLGLRRFSGALWRSLFVATIFAAHPLHVESVAWIAERKDVLSTFWALLALGCYGLSVARPGAGQATLRLDGGVTLSGSSSTGRNWLWYGAALVCFALALLSKPMVVTVPFLLFLMDFWPLDRVRLGPGILLRFRGVQSWAWLAEKAPFLVLSAAAGVVTIIAQHRGGALAPIDALPFTDRIANAVISYGRYLGKAAWPSDLVVYYPYLRGWVAWRVWSLAALLVVVTLCVIQAGKQRPYLAIGWLWFVGMLMPVIGLVQVGGQAMADRYMYLPLVGLSVMVAWGGAELSARGAGWRGVIAGAGLGLIVACTLATGRQVAVWQNTLTLFEHAVAVTPDNGLAHNNLGSEYLELRRYDEAERHLLRAIALRPGYAAAHNNLGITYARLHRTEDAKRSFLEALRLRPYYADAYNNLGNVFSGEGRVMEAVAHYLEAIEHDPANRDAHENLANILAEHDQPAEAEKEYRLACRYANRQQRSESYCEFGNFLADHKRLAEATEAYQEALRARPAFPQAENNLANALAEQGNLPEAVQHYERTIALDPAQAGAHYHLAELLARQGRLQDARQHYTAALRLRPDYSEAELALANLLLKSGNPDETAEAAAAAQRVLTREPENAAAHETLARALRALGQENEAQPHETEAARLRGVEPDLKPPPATNAPDKQ